MKYSAIVLAAGKGTRYKEKKQDVLFRGKELWKYAYETTKDIVGESRIVVVGKDIFVAVYTEDGLVPAYRDQTANKILSDCSNKGTGTSCLRIYMKK